MGGQFDIVHAARDLLSHPTAATGHQRHFATDARGIAHLNDKRYDVVTRGEMLGKGSRVKVIEVSGNRVVVKKV